MGSSELRDPVSPGDLIGEKYQVERVLGRGGMGIVVAARHVELDHPVAIKVLREGVLDGEEAALRFMQEARALAKLGSEHVVRVTDVGRLPRGTPYMVMEFLSGSDLASLLRERGPLPASDVADYLIQACAGLAEAHGQGIVHRDLKPANLFLVDRVDGAVQVKVLDFGVAKSLHGTSRLTADRMVLGSPRYMSPEQVRAPKEVDTRSDIWALGAIGFRLLSDHSPFDADTLDQQLTAMLEGKGRNLARLRPDLPPGLVDVIERCLRPDPEERPQTVAELARALVPFGPEGSAERAARVARASSRPPPPADAAEIVTVPLPASPERRAEPSRPPVEPTLHEPARAAPSARGGFRIALIVGALLVLGMGVVLASGVFGAATGMVVPKEVARADLAGANLRAADPVDLLPAATKLALSLHPRAELTGIELSQPVRDGVVDVTRDSQLYFDFEYTADNGSDGTVIVQAQRSELVGSRNPIPRTSKGLPAPKCGTRGAWKAALGAGVPPDARATFEYGKREGAATWVIEVRGHPELRREVDGQSCTVVATPLDAGR